MRKCTLFSLNEWFGDAILKLFYENFMLLTQLLKNQYKICINLLWRHPDVVNDAICRHMTSYDKKHFFLNFFSKFFHFMTKNDYFFNLVHFYGWGMHSLYLIFDLRV